MSAGLGATADLAVFDPGPIQARATFESCVPSDADPIGSGPGTVSEEAQDRESAGEGSPKGVDSAGALHPAHVPVPGRVKNQPGGNRPPRWSTRSTRLEASTGLLHR